MTSWGSYFFGVELELIALPIEVGTNLVREAYYNRLVSSLRSYGAAALAEQHGQRYSKHPEHYGKWWITRDGSLGTPENNGVALEAVSPILCTDNSWENDIDIFWRAWSQVFHQPDSSPLCGCHVHVSPSPYRQFDLSGLCRIAFGVVRYEPLVQQLLPSHRQNNKYCKPNTLRSSQLNTMLPCNSDATDLTPVKYRLDQIRSNQELRDLMQQSWDSAKERYVLWNFDNILPGNSGTIEFRGGSGVRDERQTRLWISFVVAFIHMCLNQPVECCSCCPSRPDMATFWQLLRQAAGECGVREDLPSDWAVMADSASGYYYATDSDDDSVVGKSEFEESDFDTSDNSDTTSDTSDESDHVEDSGDYEVSYDYEGSGDHDNYGDYEDSEDSEDSDYIVFYY